MPIIDTHQHLWDLDRFKLPWLKTAPQLAKSYLPADYKKATQRVYHTPEHASFVELPVVTNEP